MSEPGIEQHVLYALRNVVVRRWPFPHFFVCDVFPWKFYRERLIPYLDAKVGYAPSVEGRYEGRLFGSPDDLPELAFMRGKAFMKQVAAIFAPELAKRYANGKCTTFHDLRFVRDGVGYSIGPHTDAVWKLVSLLFYLPPSGMLRDAGTGLYVPKEVGFTCAGGPHHGFLGFDKVWQAPFVRNSCLGFFKTDKSFHGVERIEQEMRRDVLLYNIYDRELYLACHSLMDETQ